MPNSALDLARLAIVFDTTSAPGAIAAMQQVAVQSRAVGQAIDQQTVKQRETAKAAQETAAALNQLNMAHAVAASGVKRGTTDAANYLRTVQDMKRALDEEAKAAAMAASGQQQRVAAIGRLMAAQREAYQSGGLAVGAYANNLKLLQVQMDKIAGGQTALATSSKSAASEMAVLSGAVGGFVGILGFQALSALTQFTGFIGGLPGDLAHAGDEFARFNARITFAFRGSSEAAKLARQDIIAMARASGVPYSQVAQSYGDLAIAGRGPGLTRQQIGGLTGAFSMLGQMTGADNASTGRAMWQFQQALSLGRLTSQDYRFMATNMPAIDDALAAGMGVDVNTIPGRISRGEIDAKTMVDALARGVEILKQSSGGLPQTMERARGRIQTEWELMLSNMEERVQSSKLWQGIMRGIADGLQMNNQIASDDPAERIVGLRRRLRGEAHPLEIRATENQIAEAQAELNAPGHYRSQEMASRRLLRQDAETANNTTLGRGLQAADGAFSLDMQRTDIQKSITEIEHAMGIAGAAHAPAEDVERLARALTAFRTQLTRLVSVAERRAQDANFAEQDLARYGAGAGFDIAQAGRSLAEQAAVQGRPIGDSAARGIVLRERFLGAGNQLGQTDAELARRAGVAAAAGGSLAQRRAAALDASVSEYRAQFGGNLNAEQTASADALAARFRAQQVQRQRQDDAQAMADRERADRERIAAMREELAMGVRLGQQGRIALAQAERERELRREFPEIAEAAIAAERERVAEAVRVNEQLDLQRQQMAALQDAAETAGQAMGDALKSGIIAGVRNGSDAAEAILGSLQNSAERILSNIIDHMTAPLERRISEFASGALEGVFGDKKGGRGNAANEVARLGEEAARTAIKFASNMAPAAAEAAARIALTTSATTAEAGVKLKSVAVVNAFSVAVVKATGALNAMSAGSASGGASSLMAAIFGAPTGKPSGKAFGDVIPFAMGGVRASPQLFAMGGGLGMWGEAGAEAILPLKRGSDGKLGVDGGGGAAPVAITIVDQRGAHAPPVERRESRGANGERRIELFIREAVVKTLASGEADPVMQSKYGANRVMKKT